MAAMNVFKLITLIYVVLSAPVCVRAQESIVGSWQLVKQSSCVEEGAAIRQGAAELPSEGGSSPSGAIVTFKENASGEESIRILNSAKTGNAKKFYYKFAEDMLLILDKKTQMISDSYIVDKFSTDSLIISNASRPCETRIFVKINREQPN